MKTTTSYLALTLSLLQSSLTLAYAATSSQNAAPLHIRSQSPIHGIRYTPTPLGANGLEQNQTQISASTDISSIWANGDEFVMDFNMLDSRMEVNHGLGEGWTVRMSLSERRVVNAHLDQPTINFHRVMGLGQDGRLDVDKHRTLIEIPKYGIRVTNFDDAVFSRPVSAGISKQFYAKQNLRLAVTGQTQIETANSSWQQRGNLDASVQLDASKRFANFSLHGSFAQTWFEQTNMMGLPLKDNLYHASSALQWHQSNQGAWVLQYLLNEGAAAGGGELRKVNHEMSLGYQWQWQKVKTEFAVTENLFHLYNSPDIAFHGSVSVTI